MERLTVKGLVLRETPVGDNDKLLTLLTAERGKMTVSGRGVRSLRSRHMASTQQFCYASYTLVKSKSIYPYISDSELIESFFGLRGNIERLAFASYVCEVADHVSVEENGDVDLLRLVLNTLYAASAGKKQIALIKAAFELRCAAVLGMCPDLSCCSVCGVKEAQLFYLDIFEGNLVCPDCMARRPSAEKDADGDGSSYQPRGGYQRPVSIVTPEILNAMRYAIGSDIAKFLSFTLTDDALISFGDIAERHLLHQLGCSFRTLEFYKSLSVHD